MDLDVGSLRYVTNCANADDFLFLPKDGEVTCRYSQVIWDKTVIVIRLASCVTVPVYPFGNAGFVRFLE